MNASPDQGLLEAIAVELAVDPSFVEKDWHAMRLVAVVAGIEHDTLCPVFSGGTSLSKGYALIKRFSEDLDFKLILPTGGVERPDRRSYRDLVIEAIRDAGDWTIEDTDIFVADDHKFFRCPIGYQNTVPTAQALRPHLQLDMRFIAPALPVEERSLRSFVAQAQEEDLEVPAIACVSPVETAADKLSMLTWRTLTRQRGSDGDDPTSIRHLHDLVALEDLAAEHPEFPKLLHNLIDRDVATRGRARPEIADMTPVECLTGALETLADDPDYRGEYEQFVVAMSYAPEGETPEFEAALAAARRLGELFP